MDRLTNITEALIELKNLVYEHLDEDGKEEFDLLYNKIIEKTKGECD